MTILIATIQGNYSSMKDIEIIQKHDELKAEAGWYVPDWEGDLKQKAKVRERDDASRSARYGYTMTSRQTLTAPLPQGIWQGLD